MNCTEDQLRMVLERGISVEVFPIPENENAATVTGLVRLNNYDYNRYLLSKHLNITQYSNQLLFRSASGHNIMLH